MTKDSQYRDLFPGALEIMILQTLRTSAMHGYLYDTFAGHHHNRTQEIFLGTLRYRSVEILQ